VSISQITCNHWHPGKPSEIKIVRRADRKNGVGEVCATCNRARQRAKYWDKNAPNAPGDRTKSPKSDYGVLPRLTWSPPQL
jgi:hypothetical protein